MIIGRNPQCDYPIENPEQHRTVSGTHATLSETDRPDVFLFEDHSTNGSYINGRLLHNASCTVGINDQVVLGRTYTLSLADIARRYLSHSRATVKKPTGQPWPSDAYTPSFATPVDNTPLPPQSTGDYLSSVTPVSPVSPVSPTPSVPPVTPVTSDRSDTPKPKTKEKPTWYWLVLIGSIILGLIIGFAS